MVGVDVRQQTTQKYVVPDKLLVPSISMPPGKAMCLLSDSFEDADIPDGLGINPNPANAVLMNGLLQ